jgi:hypothetical protein
MLLGFSTGCLHKTHDRLASTTFDIFRNLGANAIEIMWHEGEEYPRLLDIDPRSLECFKYVSIHTPSFERFSDAEIVKMLEALAKAHERIGFRSVVLHPYETMKWAIFRQFDLPFMIENMDWRKDFGKYVESLEDIFMKFDVPMVLDVNHCYTNDPSMRLAYEMVDTLGRRIREIHVSGFEQFHEPIHRTQQTEILEAIPNRNIPIIIESGCDGIEEAKNELAYVRTWLER